MPCTPISRLPGYSAVWTAQLQTRMVRHESRPSCKTLRSPRALLSGYLSSTMARQAPTTRRGRASFSRRRRRVLALRASVFWCVRDLALESLFSTFRQRQAINDKDDHTKGRCSPPAPSVEVLNEREI